MILRTYTNVNAAIGDLPELVMMHGLAEETRNGPVLSMPEPVSVTFTHPKERVLLCPYRRSNPFLMLIDGLSILTNVNLVSPFTKFLPRFADYSDDGVTLRAHYGRRLYGQLNPALQMFRDNPSTRRVVLQIWDNELDLNTDSVDIPCNLMVVPRVLNGAVDITVFNRSNDLFWGLLGANVVQFSFLLEFLAEELGIEMGSQTHISTNLHVYQEFGPGTKEMSRFGSVDIPYPPLKYELGEYIRQEVGLLMMALDEKSPLPSFRSPFLREVVVPMLRAWEDKTALNLSHDVDWFLAAKIWFKEFEL